VQLTGRRALEDFTFQGHDIKEGDNVITLLGAANHDGETFPDPAQFRLDRKAPRALSFGGGIHYCLGAQLSRIEGEEALRALFERLPKLELDHSVLEAPEQKPTITLRGLGALPAHWA
jgi:cytochrome P450